VHDRDHETKNGLGDRPGTRRAIAATTATALATLGTMLGITGAYLTLILAYSDTVNRLTNIPLSALTAIAGGIPALALLTTWLTTSRQPPSINRPVVD
jgi:isopropylmalate/homocitrate/citramalate synthase